MKKKLGAHIVKKNSLWCGCMATDSVMHAKPILMNVAAANNARLKNNLTHRNKKEAFSVNAFFLCAGTLQKNLLQVPAIPSARLNLSVARRVDGRQLHRGRLLVADVHRDDVVDVEHALLVVHLARNERSHVGPDLVPTIPVAVRNAKRADHGHGVLIAVERIIHPDQQNHPLAFGSTQPPLEILRGEVLSATNLSELRRGRLRDSCLLEQGRKRIRHLADTPQPIEPLAQHVEHTNTSVDEIEHDLISSSAARPVWTRKQFTLARTHFFVKVNIKP